jgi:hypothetical protein
VLVGGGGVWLVAGADLCPVGSGQREEAMSSKTLHMGITKQFLLSVIRARGAKFVLDNWEGTDEEAIAMIENDPREVFTSGCDDADETGRCKGHGGKR